MPGDAAITIGPMAPAEFPAVTALLEGAGLPAGGLEDHRDTLLVAREGDRVVGSAALERYGTSALLRSVAVDAAWRGRGLGVGLTEAALALAHRLGVERLYLLTETAKTFFPRFGFAEIARTEVEPAVLASEEFRTLCPESATVMKRGPAGTAAP